MVDNLKESALKYAKDSMRVFPLRANSKKDQVLSSWKDEATTDKGTIENWWNKNPNYNIGIATGNNLLVIDVDVKHESKGRESIEKYGLLLPPTAKVKTPSGGYHLYYYVKGEFKNKVNLYPGIDIRTDNGYVVAPPSMIDGKCYEWANDEPIVEANEAVYKFLKGPDNKEKEAPLHIDNKLTEGTRNDTLFRLASSLQSQGLSDEAISSSVNAENLVKCNPPLERDEVKSIVDSALKYKKGTAPYKETEKELNLGVTCVSEIEEKEAEWLIPGFIPKGTLTIISGDGGTGKTSVMCDIIASISSGLHTFFEDENYSIIEKRTPQKVMFFSSEDDISTTLKKRLRLNGADMENVITIPMRDERFARIKYNSEFLKDLIYTHKPSLLVFDPLQGFLPNNVNMGQRNHMRNTLSPLLAYGEEMGVTTIIISHTNKKSDVSARGRISDSSDIWDIARNVFIVGVTNENNLRYLSHEKCNLGILQDTALFSIDDGAVTYRGTTKKKDRDFMSSKSYERKNKVVQDEAKEFILEQLREHDGNMENKELLEYAKACGYAKATLERAKKELKKDEIINIDTKGFGKEKGAILSLAPKEG